MNKMDPQKITELANLFRVNGDKILNSEFTLTLSGSLLRALNDSFTLIADSVEIGDQQKFQVTKPINSKSPVFRDLQLVYDFVQKTTLLCIMHYPTEDYFAGTIDIRKFHALRRLETRKINIRQIVGIQPLRAQLQELICIKSLQSVDDIITHCGGDHSNGFVWNSLKIANFSYNNLQTIDTSLEFAQFLQHLNLRHNKLHSVEAIKWLPHLKSLDLSYNCLQYLPQFHTDAYKRLQHINLSNNFIEDLVGIAKMDALCVLDLSDNLLLNHTCLLPLSALMTLTNLNLYGNPLHCHPKHRLATAQFLHKNISTVKFLLDLEPLTQNEKAVTGKHQMRHANSMQHYITKSSSISLSSSNQATPNSQTPSSSVGSLLSFRFQENAVPSNSKNFAVTTTTTRKKNAKTRCVEIEDDKSALANANDVHDAVAFADCSGPLPLNDDVAAPLDNSTSVMLNKKEKADLLTQSLFESAGVGHLEAKRHIEQLREKYGSEWLQSGNAELVQSALGIESKNEASTKSTEKDRNKSRQLFDEFLGEFSESAMQARAAQLNNNTNDSRSKPRTSTPMNESTNPFDEESKTLTYTPIKDMHGNQQRTHNESTLYESLDNNNDSTVGVNDEKSLYTTADNVNATNKDEDNENDVIVDAKEVELRNVYARAADVESEESEQEDEETYIVYTNKNNLPLFLTLSENFLREKDVDTNRTMTKWSLKILESCERVRSNVFRMNFDTIKADRKERVYTVEEELCQELEKKLRNILSQRGLSEMNQTIYRCVNCSCQFSRENKTNSTFDKPAIRCPDCNSAFVAEIHETPKSLSPAAIVKETPITTTLTKTPLTLAKSQSASSRGFLQAQESVESTEPEAEADSSNSIGSATSLNESSSCSKLSQRSQSSFDSNRSVVGSTNSERDLDFNVNGESDVDIISNPSQSSIEVLDRISYVDFDDRRISQQPNLETIDDNSFQQTYTAWHLNTATTATEAKPSSSNNKNSLINFTNSSKTTSDKLPPAPAESSTTATTSPNPLAHFQLTESSSSGSVTDSICTTYAPDKSRNIDEKVNSNDLLAQERGNATASRTDVTTTESNSKNNEQKVDSNGRAPLKNFYQTLFQSTNTLMSSSKKLIDAEAAANIKSGEKLPQQYVVTAATATSLANSIMPYKFDYSDFNNIDHRLKLYFYQTKFHDVGEHFKWLVRGRIYNENTQTLNVGIVAMSTTRLYLMEAFATENDDVTKWLRPIITVSVNRLESVQLLPWKLGCAFQIRDWGGFLLLLQDIFRTDSLLLFFANNPLPHECELLHQPDECILKRLSRAANFGAAAGEKLNMFALLNGCEISCDNAKRSLQICGLLTTDTYLLLTTNKFTWLTTQQTAAAAAEDSEDFEIECCVTQLMSNLVEIVEVNELVRVINFLDETQNKTAIWRLSFETKENADSCLNAIDQSWQKLFGVSLFDA